MDNRLEARYEVLKLSRMTPRQRAALDSFLDATGICHTKVDAVVIESDWPEYDATVNLLWERINDV